MTNDWIIAMEISRMPPAQLDYMLAFMCSRDPALFTEARKAYEAREKEEASGQLRMQCHPAG